MEENNHKEMQSKEEKSEIEKMKENLSKNRKNEEVKAEEVKTEKKVEEKKDVKVEEKKEVKKESKKEPARPKKDEAIVKGFGLPISTKQSMALCDFIKGKRTQEALKDLQEVIKLKKVVPMKGEIPHRHGKGIMSGRYPVEASKHFIKLIKTLEGNARVNGLGENPKITYASASIASRPFGRFGAHRKKRTYILLKTQIQLDKKIEMKKNNKKEKLEVKK